MRNPKPVETGSRIEFGVEQVSTPAQNQKPKNKRNKRNKETKKQRKQETKKEINKERHGLFRGGVPPPPTPPARGRFQVISCAPVRGDLMAVDFKF